MPALRRLVAPTLMLVALFVPATVFAQQPTSKSAMLATELAKMLETMKLDSAAAKMADSYVGALYIPGSQLLVINGKAAGARLDYLITQKSFRDVYVDLNGIADPKSRVLISDLGANGLRFKRDENQFDMVDVPGKSYSFDGDWGKAKMSEDEYTKSYRTYDDQYSQMLQALIDQLKKSS